MTVVLAVGGCLVFASCSKPPVPPPAVPVASQPPAKSVPGATQPGDPSTPQPSTGSSAPSTVTPAQPPSLSPAQQATILAPINAALDSFQRTKNKVPNDLNEVVASGLLRGLPPVPAGWKIFYDPITVTVSIAPVR